MTVAAHGRRVVVASINFHLPRHDSYEIGTADEFRKIVAVNVSSDSGATFGPAIDPGVGDGTFLGDQTTDPVVRVAREGVFYLSVLRSKVEGDGALASSPDGRSWKTIATPTVVDKPWFAIDDSRQELYIGAAGGYSRFSFDGTLRQAVAAASDRQMQYLMADAYADSDGAHFAAFGMNVVNWRGDASPATLVGMLDAGNEAEEYTSVAWNRGPLVDGTWTVHARKHDGRASIILRVERGAEVAEQPITSPEEHAFLPAAVMDESSILHVVWYDSSGPNGVLKYTRSVDPAPFLSGFAPPLVIDPNACPGDRWYPGFDSNSGRRRLREYIGIHVHQGLVHVAWTHSPAPPSRVYATTIRPEPN